jgi:hypothetical protein
MEQSFVCAHLKVVNIECKEVDAGVHKILTILRTCGILRDHISIKALSSPSYCKYLFSFFIHMLCNLLCSDISVVNTLA